MRGGGLKYMNPDLLIGACCSIIQIRGLSKHLFFLPSIVRAVFSDPWSYDLTNAIFKYFFNLR